MMMWSKNDVSVSSFSFFCGAYGFPEIPVNKTFCRMIYLVSYPVIVSD